MDASKLGTTVKEGKKPEKHCYLLRRNS